MSRLFLSMHFTHNVKIINIDLQDFTFWGGVEGFFFFGGGGGEEPRGKK